MRRICLYMLLLILISTTAHTRELAGIRGVQIRSDQVVTVWLGYLATTDTTKLYDKSLYKIISPNDAEFKEAQNPIQISRFSKGSRSAGGPFDWRALMDQYMHLKLPFSMKAGKKYVVMLEEGLIPKDCQRTAQFSLEETPNPSFKLNQLGYSNASSKKLIYLSSYLGDGQPIDLDTYETFEVCDAHTHEIVLTGSIKFVTDQDKQGKDKLYVLDISELFYDGVFYVRVEGLGRSYSFLNGRYASRKLFDVISHGMYFQRCGAEIVQPWADQWPRPMSHNQVYVPKKNIVHPWEIHVDPMDESAGDWYCPDGPHEIHGGHHDAGDYDTRLTHFAVSEKLMTLFEMRPDQFYDGQSKIPEHDNGIPDIIDEALWSLKHIETLQDLHGEVRGDFGAVPPGMESHTHPPKFACTGDGDPLPYWTRKATPYTTFCGAALFAQAARLARRFDIDRSLMFVARAKAAYEWAVKNRGMKWEPENPKVLPLDWEEVYDDEKLNGAWCWAAGQLFSTTGDDSYFDAFKKRYKTAGNLFQQHPWTAIFPILVTQKTVPDMAVKDWVREKLIFAADTSVAWIMRNGKTGYQAPCRNRGPWGWGNPITNLDVFIRAWYITKEQKYRDAIASGVDFTLGMNPSEMSWMTGAGSVYPMDPLSANSKYDGVEEPLPGIVIFGPTENWKHNQNPLYPNPENMGFYRRISDVWGYVEGCEYVVDEQQTNMFVAAGILLE